MATAGWPTTDSQCRFPHAPATTTTQCHPERSEGSAVAFGNPEVALLPSSPPYARDLAQVMNSVNILWCDCVVRFHNAMKNCYRVFFHQGQEIGLKTHVSKGNAWIDSSGLHIEGSGGTSFVAVSNIKEVEMFRLHGLGRVIRVDYQGGRLYLSVVRFMIGQFALINFFKTGALHKILAGLAKAS